MPGRPHGHPAKAPAGANIGIEQTCAGPPGRDHFRDDATTNCVQFGRYDHKRRARHNIIGGAHLLAASTDRNEDEESAPMPQMRDRFHPKGAVQADVDDKPHSAITAERQHETAQKQRNTTNTPVATTIEREDGRNVFGRTSRSESLGAS